MDFELLKNEMQEKTGKFVVDHAEFVKNWTMKNLQPENGVGAYSIAAGIGMSAGLFCSTISDKLGMGSETLRSIIVEQMDKTLRGDN